MSNTNADLREVYLLAFDNVATDPSEVAATFDGINTRYARELLATLVQGKMLSVTDANGEDRWQTEFDVDNTDRKKVVKKIDTWLEKNNPEVVKSAPKPKGEPHPCRCGCGDLVPSKSNYRPGHDARHAGIVGRKIAERYAEPGFDRRTLLADLPSDSLKAKAEKVAETAIAKMEARHAKKNGQTDATVDAGDDGTDSKEHGTVKVGKTEYAAVRYTATGLVEYFHGADIKAASKTAAKTFTVG